MIGWNHRIKYWVLVFAQGSAVIGYGVIIGNMLMEGRIGVALIVWVGAVLVASLIVTLRRDLL